MPEVAQRWDETYFVTPIKETRKWEFDSRADSNAFELVDVEKHAKTREFDCEREEDVKRTIGYLVSCATRAIKNLADYIDGLDGKVEFLVERSSNLDRPDDTENVLVAMLAAMYRKDEWRQDNETSPKVVFSGRTSYETLQFMECLMFSILEHGWCFQDESWWLSKLKSLRGPYYSPADGCDFRAMLAGLKIIQPEKADEILEDQAAREIESLTHAVNAVSKYLSKDENN
jgi:hypothetical protein